MNEREEYQLRQELDSDELGRDRGKYNYTYDSVERSGAMPLSIWPESNSNVRKVIDGEIEYNSLPYDEDNEVYKGMLTPEQQDVVIENEGKEVLCEALDMNPCLGEKCELYRTDITPPVCREFKMAFEK